MKIEVIQVMEDCKGMKKLSLYGFDQESNGSVKHFINKQTQYGMQ